MNYYIGGVELMNKFDYESMPDRFERIRDFLHSFLPKDLTGDRVLVSTAEIKYINIFTGIGPANFEANTPITMIDYLKRKSDGMAALWHRYDAHGLLVEEKEFDIAKAAFFWVDGYPEKLVDILLALGRTEITVCILEEDAVKTVEVTDIEDIRKLLIDNESDFMLPGDYLDLSDQTRILEKLELSDRMGSFLKDIRLTKRQTVKLVLGSLLSLDAKEEILYGLSRLENECSELVELFSREKRGQLPKQLHETVQLWSFGQNSNALWQGKNYCSGCLGLDADSPTGDIYLTHGEWDKENHWFEYVADDDGWVIDETAYGRGYLDVPQPFHAGDIVKLDCLSYAAPTNALLLEPDGPSYSTPILYRSHPGVWALSRINIGRRWGDDHSCLSPLYRLQEADTLADDERILETLQDLIKTDPVFALELRGLIRAHATDDEVSDVDLRNILAFFQQQKRRKQ